MSIAFLAVLAPMAHLGAVQTHAISEVWQSDLRDATFTSKVVTGNQRELSKINKDFANSYRFKQMTVKMKEPFKLRLESTVDDTDILFIMNGSRRLVRIPRANVNERKDLAMKPGQRQTAFDFGLLTPSLFDGLFVAKFVRVDRETGNYVFDLTYEKRLDDDTRHRIWVDKAKKVVTKREWYSQLDFRLQAVFTYEDPKEVNGVWIPTKVSVRNTDGKLAGVTQNTNIKVNVGLADTLFSVS